MSNSPVIEEILEKSESWKNTALKHIDIPSQYLAFQLSMLSEERVRVLTITGNFEHEEIRQAVFALEWSLRSLPFFTK